MLTRGKKKKWEENISSSRKERIQPPAECQKRPEGKVEWQKRLVPGKKLQLRKAPFCELLWNILVIIIYYFLMVMKRGR